MKKITCLVSKDETDDGCKDQYDQDHHQKHCKLQRLQINGTRTDLYKIYLLFYLLCFFVCYIMFILVANKFDLI